MDIVTLYHNLHGEHSKYNRQGRKAQKILDIVTGVFMIDRRDRIHITELYKIIHAHPLFEDEDVSDKHIRNILLRKWDIDDGDFILTREVRNDWRSD